MSRKMTFTKTEMKNAVAVADEFGYMVRMSTDGSVQFEPVHAAGRDRSASGASIEDFMGKTDAA